MCAAPAAPAAAAQAVGGKGKKRKKRKQATDAHGRDPALVQARRVDSGAPAAEPMAVAEKSAAPPRLEATVDDAAPVAVAPAEAMEITPPTVVVAPVAAVSGCVAAPAPAAAAVVVAAPAPAAAIAVAAPAPAAAMVVAAPAPAAAIAVAAPAAAIAVAAPAQVIIPHGGPAQQPGAALGGLDAAVMAALAAPLPPIQNGDILVTEDMKADILRNMLIGEVRHAVAGDLQGVITTRMWAILIDWLFEVQFTYALRQTSLFLGVNILARFLRVSNVVQGELQLAGATALLVACKFEEFDAPSAAEFVYVCADAYTQENFFQMETRIITTLDYKVRGRDSASRNHPCPMRGGWSADRLWC